MAPLWYSVQIEGKNQGNCWESEWLMQLLNGISGTMRVFHVDLISERMLMMSSGRSHCKKSLKVIVLTASCKLKKCLTSFVIMTLRPVCPNNCDLRAYQCSASTCSGLGSIWTLQLPVCCILDLHISSTVFTNGSKYNGQRVENGCSINGGWA